MCVKVLIKSRIFSYLTVGIIVRRIGPKGRIVVPKVFREVLGLEPRDEIAAEIREGELSIRPVMESFVEDFCSIPKKKVNEKNRYKKGF